MGGWQTGGVRVFDEEVVRAAASQPAIEEATDIQRAELERREQLYRGGGPAPDLRDRTVETEVVQAVALPSRTRRRTARRPGRRRGRRRAPRRTSGRRRNSRARRRGRSL